MNEEEIRDIELAEKVNKIIYYDFKDDIKNDIFIVLDALVNATELKDLSATQKSIKNQYYIIQNKNNEHLEKIIQNQKAELQKKDKIIDEIQKEVRDHIGFENRLKRDNKEPDLFNQGRFYVANNINNILKRK